MGWSLQRNAWFTQSSLTPWKPKKTKCLCLLVQNKTSGSRDTVSMNCCQQLHDKLDNYLSRALLACLRSFSRWALRTGSSLSSSLEEKTKRHQKACLQFSDLHSSIPHCTRSFCWLLSHLNLGIITKNPHLKPILWKSWVQTEGKDTSHKMHNSYHRRSEKDEDGGTKQTNY